MRGPQLLARAGEAALELVEIHPGDEHLEAFPSNPVRVGRRGREHDVVPTLAHGGCEGEERQEVPIGRSRAEEDAHSSIIAAPWA